MRERRCPGRPSGPSDWRLIPELRLIVLGLALELPWEVAHFPLYTLWHEHPWTYSLYGLVHCTLGDLLILLAAHALVAAANRDRCWMDGRHPWLNGLAFTALGAGYTIYSEVQNVWVKGAWEYTERMPLVPPLDVGATPLLQWLLLPLILVWLARTVATTPPQEASG